MKNINLLILILGFLAPSSVLATREENILPDYHYLGNTMSYQFYEAYPMCEQIVHASYFSFIISITNNERYSRYRNEIYWENSQHHKLSAKEFDDELKQIQHPRLKTLYTDGFGCFAGNTEIKTLGINRAGTNKGVGQPIGREVNLKKIADINPGDYVLSHTTEMFAFGSKYRMPCWSRVAKVRAYEADPQKLVKLVVKKDASEVMTSPVNEFSIFTTAKHPFFVSNNKEKSGKWVKAENLSAGDDLFDSSDISANQFSVISTTMNPVDRPMGSYIDNMLKRNAVTNELPLYNLSIELTHTFYIEPGVLVHNR